MQRQVQELSASTQSLEQFWPGAGHTSHRVDEEPAGDTSGTTRIRGLQLTFSSQPNVMTNVVPRSLGNQEKEHHLQVYALEQTLKLVWMSFA